MVIVPVALAVGRSGELEGALFLIVMMTFAASAHLESLTRAIAVTTLAAASTWLIAVVSDDGIGWQPWAMANLFVLVLGRTQVRQRQLIEQLERARQALADQAVAEERQAHRPRAARPGRAHAGGRAAACDGGPSRAAPARSRRGGPCPRRCRDGGSGEPRPDPRHGRLAAHRRARHGPVTGRCRRPAGAGRGLPARRARHRRVDRRACHVPRWPGRHGAAPGRPRGSGQRRPPCAGQPRHAHGRCLRRRRPPRRGRPRAAGVVAGSRGDAVRPRRHGRAGQGARRSVHGGPTADGWRVEACLPIVELVSP